MPSDNRDLADLLRFVERAEALNNVLRSNLTISGRRRENSAEHSWHCALLASVMLSKNSRVVDPYRILVMLLIHDIVEIEVGDFSIHDKNVNWKEVRQKELSAAEYLLGSISFDENLSLFQIWREFNDQKTLESRFAAACDRLQPILMNLATDGHTWFEHGVSKSELLARVQVPIQSVMPEVWSIIEQRIDEHFSQLSC